MTQDLELRVLSGIHDGARCVVRDGALIGSHGSLRRGAMRRRYRRGSGAAADRHGELGNAQSGPRRPAR